MKEYRKLLTNSSIEHYLGQYVHKEQVSSQGLIEIINTGYKSS